MDTMTSVIQTCASGGDVMLTMPVILSSIL